MKKTIYSIAALAMAATMAQAATIWTTTFDNAAQTTPTAVTLINTLDPEVDLTGTIAGEVASLTGATTLMATGSDIATNPAIFTPNRNVLNNGPWTATFTFTNNTGSEITLDALTFNVVSFSSSGGGQNHDKLFKLSVNLEEVSTSAIVSVTGMSYSDGVFATLNLSDVYTIADGSSVSVEVTAEASTQTDGSFFGLKSMAFNGQVVPEPATASLSLLGLAALMMRRRRA